MLPEHGAWLAFAPSGALPSLHILLDLGRGLLIVLRDEGEDRWDGRQHIGGGDRSMFGGRLARLPAGSTEARSGALRLRWAGPGGQGDRVLDHLSPAASQGVVAFARDLCRYALSARLDHPLAGLALARWNEQLGFEATAQFLDGEPRGVRLVGFVDPAGQRNLDALRYVLKPGEPLLVDVSQCRSLGAWEPQAILSEHVVAWVGAQDGVEARLRDEGVPEQAFHGTAESARRWLRVGAGAGG